MLEFHYFQSAYKKIWPCWWMYCVTKAWWWQAGHFLSQGKKEYKYGEEKHLWQEGLIKNNLRSMFYASLQMDGTPVHLLTQHKHNGAPSTSAQTTGWRKADTWRLPHTKIQQCKEIPMWQTRGSLWPHNNLLWKCRWKDSWAHAAMIKNVLGLSEAFRFKLRPWK